MAFLDRLTDPRHRELYAYWDGKRSGRRMPRRSELDPIEIPQLLPNIMIVEVVDNERFRFRLVGTAIVQAFGQDSTGRFLDEITNGEYRDFILGVYRGVCRHGRPVFAASEFVTSKGYAVIANRLMLPLSEDGSAVDRIIGIHLFHYGEAAPAIIELDQAPLRHETEILAG
jgi:hypothetical protein